MCVWTKKRGSMKAEVLMATPCPKSLEPQMLMMFITECSGTRKKKTDSVNRVKARCIPVQRTLDGAS